MLIQTFSKNSTSTFFVIIINAVFKYSFSIVLSIKKKKKGLIREGIPKDGAKEI